MVDFLAGALFTMGVWAIVMNRLADKLTEEAGHDMKLAKGFFAAYVLVLVLLLGMMMGALFL